MKIGDEWVYRQRDQDPSERVKILSIEQKKQTFRADVEFMDGDRAGTLENVPGRRLKVPWSDVANYDLMAAAWERLDECILTEAEDVSAVVVFDEIIPEGVVEHHYRGPVRGVTAVRDRTALDELLEESLDFVLDRCQWLEDDGVLVVSPRGTVLIAELACRKNPMPILACVSNEEKVARHNSKHGSTEPGRSGKEPTRFSAEYEYSFYVRWTRPQHELLRQWCGHRTVTLQERLVAAESEVQRLDELLQTTLDCLEAMGDEINSNALTREHVERRITPENIRPMIEDPEAWKRFPRSPEPRRFRRSWW